MDSKFALITGSSQGLGLEIAKKLAHQHIKVCLVGRDEKKLKTANQQLGGDKDHEYFCGDLTDDDGLGEMFKKFDQKKLFPTIIIHCLGGKVSGDEQPLLPAVLQRSIKINVEVSTAINAHYLPVMEKKQCGRIIHISSDASVSGESAPGYAAAKAAINGYVKSTARYYAKHGVMICSVLPSVFEHEGSVWSKKKLENPDHYQKKIEKMPLGRFGSVSEVAEFVAHVAVSDNMMYAGSLVPLTGASL